MATGNAGGSFRSDVKKDRRGEEGGGTQEKEYGRGGNLAISLQSWLVPYWSLQNNIRFPPPETEIGVPTVPT